MRIKRYHYLALVFAVFIITFDFLFFLGSKMFLFMIGLALMLLAFPFLFDAIYQAGKEKEKEEMFLEFLNDLSESVKVGIPISRSILNISKRDYKSLDVHVKKLASQIAIGISLREALNTFAKDTKNKLIARVVELISQAERAGGRIESVLDASVRSVREIQDINKKRSTAVHSMIMQGYIIFFIFLIIMVVMQVKFVPVIVGLLGGVNENVYGLSTYGSGLFFGGSGQFNLEFFNTIVFITIVIQSLFTGIVIGKLSEGKIVVGLKHSFILIVISFLILQGARMLM